MGSANGSGGRGLDPLVYQEYALLSELTLLGQQCLDGIYVIPKAMTPFEWMGVIFLRRGHYQSGIFRFTLHIPESFPDTNELPKLVFEQHIFHPFIHPEKHTLDLSRYFKDGWKAGTHHIYHALIFLQRAFYSFSAGDAAAAPNQEALALLQSNPAELRARIAASVRASREAVYEEPREGDPHAIRFSPWDQALHGRQRDLLLKPPPPSAPARPGLSWTELAGDGTALTCLSLLESGQRDPPPA